MNNKNFFKDYEALFELGLLKDNPAVKVLGDFEICPTVLAALVTTLFETVMGTVDEDKQIQYEALFNKALKILMKERFKYDITRRFVGDDDDEQTSPED